MSLWKKKHLRICLLPKCYICDIFKNQLPNIQTPISKHWKSSPPPSYTTLMQALSTWKYTQISQSGRRLKPMRHTVSWLFPPSPLQEKKWKRNLLFTTFHPTRRSWRRRRVSSYSPLPSFLRPISTSTAIIGWLKIVFLDDDVETEDY